MMKFVGSLSLPLLAFAFGCNTAQVNTPPLQDAGPRCDDPSRTLFTCDASAPATPGSCAGGVTVTLDLADASATIPPGTYAQSCRVTFSHQNPEGADCLLYSPCACVDDGGSGDAGTWSCAVQ
jgi:hypothetical protein